MNLKQMGGKSSRSQEQSAWLLRHARACSIFQWGSPFRNRTQDILYVLKKKKKRSITPLFMNNELMFFHDSQINTFILLTSLGFVCVLWGTMPTQEESSVWCTSVLSGDMSPQRPNFKSECQRNGFLGKSHMIVFYKSGT